jgi:hypothetical protein
VPEQSAELITNSDMVLQNDGIHDRILEYNTNMQGGHSGENQSEYGSFSLNDHNSSQMSPAMAAAAEELIQKFMINPSAPVSAQDFLIIQGKYGLSPPESYQLLVQ